MESKIGNMDGAEDNRIIKGDEIDLVSLVRLFFQQRRILFFFTVLSLLGGMVVAILYPKKYTVTATILPINDRRSSSTLGGLSSLAGLAGINLSSMMGDATGIDPKLYPEIITNHYYLKELIDVKVNFEKEPEPISVCNYLAKDSLKGVGEYILDYSLYLPWTIKRILQRKSTINGIDLKIDSSIVSPSLDEIAAMSYIQRSIWVEIDKKTGLVYFSVQLDEPIVTAQIAQNAINLLEKYIIDYKTRQVRETYDFIKSQFEEKKLDYEQKQRMFFQYKDEHRNLIAERVDVEYQRLSDSYEVALSVYKGLAQQLEQAEISVKEQTPAFSILRPVQIPFEKSSPGKIFILFVSGVIGVLFGMGFIVVRFLLKAVKL